MTTDGARTIHVAAGQVAARFMNEAPATLASLESLIVHAARRRADLLVLPECAYPAYLLGSVASYRAGNHLRSEAFVQWLSEQAARHHLHIVSGFVEDTGTCLHNSAVLLDDRGCELGRARKRFRWHLDHEWYDPGNRIAAFDSRVGRVGVVICAETRVPEIVAALIADGAELLAMPTCWINGSREPGRFTNPQVDFLVEARAREFGVPFVCADKSGMELAGVGYVGASRIVRADGSLAAEAPPTGETVVSAEIGIGQGRRPPRHAAALDRVIDRQPPVRPTPEDLPQVTLAVLPASPMTAVGSAETGEVTISSLREQGVDVLLVRTTDPRCSERLKEQAASIGIRVLPIPDTDQVLALGSARIACLTSAESFVQARAHALDGAALLVFGGSATHLSILRARAIENRVFVVAAGDRAALIISPDGAVLAATDDRPAAAAVARVELADAANKLVAPMTDLFDQRQVQLYRFI
jgi:predicted amidohydrolase